MPPSTTNPRFPLALIAVDHQHVAIDQRVDDPRVLLAGADEPLSLAGLLDQRVEVWPERHAHSGDGPSHKHVVRVKVVPVALELPVVAVLDADAPRFLGGHQVHPLEYFVGDLRPAILESLALVEPGHLGDALGGILQSHSWSLLAAAPDACGRVLRRAIPSPSAWDRPRRLLAGR
jgi:hypothetical protein